MKDGSMRLIDAETLCYDIRKLLDCEEIRVEDVLEIIEQQPTIKGESRHKGEWIDTTNGDHYKCSVCGYKAGLRYVDSEDILGEWLSDYCPNCGARMEE